MFESAGFTKDRIDNIFHLMVKVQVFIDENTKVFCLLNHFDLLTFACQDRIGEVVIGVGLADYHKFCLGGVQLQTNIIKVTVQ